MTDKEIIKALECYIKENEFEYFHSNTMCEYPLIRKALNLINRQKANYEALKAQEEKTHQYCKNVCEPKHKAEIKRLLTENKMLLTRLTRFKEEIAQPYLLINADAESTAKMIEALKTQKTLIVPGNEATVEYIDKASIKAEAVKEFAELLKEHIRDYHPYYYVIDEEVVDNLVEEMAGEDNAPCN